MNLLFYLIAGHFIADYPLQGDFLARGKNHKLPLQGVPWYQCLLAHSFIHGAFVAIITGSLVLGILEVFLHAIIDFGKSNGWYGFNVDQLLHFTCKVFYVLIIYYL